MFDSHAHLDFPSFSGRLAQTLGDARSVSAWFVPGYALGELGAARELDELARRPEFLGRFFWGVGVHPWRLEEAEGERSWTLGELQRALVRRAHERGAVAIGEVGLDGVRQTRVPWELQRRVLGGCLDVSEELDLPLVLHVVRAEGELRRALSGRRLPQRAGVVHAFQGSLAFAEWLVARGFKLGVGSLLVRQTERGQDTRLRAALAQVPLDALVLETDAVGPPYQAVELERAAAALAHLRGVPAGEVVQATERAARELFARPLPDEVGAGPPSDRA